MSILYTQCLATELAKPANQLISTGAGVPVLAPSGAVRLYVDTSTTPDSLYYWTGLAWSLLGDGVGSGVGSSFGCTEVAACIAALPTGAVASAGTLLLGNDGSFHALPTLSGGGGSGTTVTFATDAEAQAGASTVLAVTPANLWARDAMTAQAGLSMDVSAIAAPASGQSAWGQNTQGETLHYAPGLGWKVVADKLRVSFALAGPHSAATTETVVHTYITPRAGVLAMSGYAVFHGLAGEVGVPVAAGFTENGLSLVYSSAPIQTIINGAHITVSITQAVAAGDVLNFRVTSGTGSATIYADNCAVAYSYVD